MLQRKEYVMNTIIHMKQGFGYEDLARAWNVLLFEINIKWIQKSEFEFIYYR